MNEGNAVRMRIVLSCLAVCLCIVDHAMACPGLTDSGRAGTAEAGAATATAGDRPGPDGARGFGADFSHLISLESNNYDSDCNPWLTDDESELFFIRYAGKSGPADPGHQGGWDIYRSEWDPVQKVWGPATNLGPNISTADADRRPTTTAGGDTLLFSRGSFIHYSIRTGGEFGPATQLFHGFDPCLSSDAQTLYYVLGNDIWVANRGPSGQIDDWVNQHALGPPVNTPAAEVRPYISRDGSMLFFSDFSNPRFGGYGDADIWVSTWTGSAWGPPENVGAPINVDRPACTPWLSADARRLYVSSESSEGSRGTEDVWVAHRDSSVAPQLVSPPPGMWTKLGELDGAWNVYDLVADAAGNYFAATHPAGEVYRSTDAGATWTGLGTLPGAAIVYSLLVIENGTLFAGTYPNGDVFRSTDQGDSWTLTANLPGATAVRALLQTADGRVLAGTSPLCRVFATTTSGASWVQLGATVSIQSSISCLFESSSGLLFAGGWGRPNVSTNGGVTWQPFFNFAGMGSIESFLEATDGKLWMTGWDHNEGGFVASSADDGQTWDRATQVTVDSLISVRVYDIVELPGGDLMVGFQPGPDRVASVTTDGGFSWSTVGALAGAREILRFLQLDDGTLLAATTPNGDVFEWTPGTTGIEDPTPPQETPRPGVAAVIGGAPNPFRSGATISYQLPDDGEATLSIVDAQGRHVRTLHQGRTAAGVHEESWDGLDARGARVASGVYFAKLRAGESVTFQKMVALR